MDVDRVAAIHSIAGFGSGYALGGGLCMTAWHVVSAGVAVAGDVKVRLRSGGWEPATHVWHDVESDVCILAVTADAARPFARFARLASVDPVNVRSIGYPRAQATVDGARPPHQIEATLTPETRPTPRMVGINVTTAAPLDTPHGSPWQGASGSAVLCGPYVVGVLVRDPANWEPARLDAVLLQELPAAFAEATTIGDSVPSWVEVRAGASGFPLLTDLDDFESGLNADLLSLSLQRLWIVGASVGLGYVPNDKESAASIIARELAACIGDALDAAVGSVRVESLEMGVRIYQRVAPYAWLHPMARASLRSYLTSADERRVVAINSGSVRIGDACVWGAARAYRVLPQSWCIGKAVVGSDFADTAAWASTIERAVFEALGTSKEQLEAELGITVTLDDVLRDSQKSVVVVFLPGPVDGELLNDLRTQFANLVLTVLDGEQDHDRLVTLVGDGGLLINPPIDPQQAKQYVMRVCTSG